MNSHNDDLPDSLNENECSKTVSIDSLERVEDDIRRSMEEESIRDSLDEAHGNHANSPSFANLLSSSTVETCEITRVQSIHSPTSISNDRTDNSLSTKTSRPASKTNSLPTNVLSASKDSRPRGPTDCIEILSPHVNQHSHRKSSHDEPFVSSSPIRPGMRTEVQLTPSGTDQHSRIPVPVRSKTFTSEVNQNDLNALSSKPDEVSSKGSVVSKAGMEVTLSLDVAVAPPRTPTRTYSHHTIERPKKDFVQLNKQQEFRRTKTYHSLHLEKLREKTHAQVSGGHTKDSKREYVQEALVHDTAETNISTEPDLENRDKPKTPRLERRHQSQKSTPAPSSETSENETSGHGPEGLPSPCSCSTPLSTRQLSERRRRSRIPVRVRRRSSGGADQFHESRLSYSTGSQSEYELTQPPAAKHSLIDVNDNRALLLEGSAPCLLESPVLEYRTRGRSSDLILLEEHDTAAPPKAAPPTGGCLQKAVVTPPNRVILPPRHVEYTPKLTPYPRKYINMGRLGPDPEAVRQRQEKARRQQKYADEVSRKNRAGVKKIGYSHQPAPEDQPSATQKMAEYAKTIPKPKVKPKSPSPERSSSEGSPMSKIRLLLSGSGSDLTSPRGGAALSGTVGATPRPPPARGRGSRASSGRVSAGHPDPRPVRRPGRGRAQPAPARDSTPPVAPPVPAGRPPSAGRPRRSSSLGRARVTPSLHRLRTLTERLVAGEAEAGPARPDLSGDSGARLCRSDTRSTLASEPESEYSTDSLQDAGRPPVVSLGRRRSARSPRGRAQFPPPTGGVARRPGLRCSRAVGPDGPRALAGSAARYPSVEDVFYDTVERAEEAWTGDSAPRRPGVTRGTQARLQDTFLVPRKDPLVVDIGLPQGGATGGSPRTATRPRTRRDISPDSLSGSPRERAARRGMSVTRDQEVEKREEAARYNEVAGALADSLCGSLTAGLGVHSPRPREMPRADLSPLPPPAQRERPPRPANLSESLQRLHERHLRDKQRVDELLAGSLSRF